MLYEWAMYQFNLHSWFILLLHSTEEHITIPQVFMAGVTIYGVNYCVRAGYNSNPIFFK